MVFAFHCIQWWDCSIVFVVVRSARTVPNATFADATSFWNFPRYAVVAICFPPCFKLGYTAKEHPKHSVATTFCGLREVASALPPHSTLPKHLSCDLLPVVLRVNVKVKTDHATRGCRSHTVACFATSGTKVSESQSSPIKWLPKETVPSIGGCIDDRQITHLIGVRLRSLLYDFLGGVLGLLPVAFLI